MNDYELYHHGIKGQKWGVRRTAAQLGHRVASAASKAGKATGKAVSKGAKIAKKAAVNKVKQVYTEHKEKKYYAKLHKKKLSQMTDKEIADLTKRVKVEAGLKDAKYESRVQNARKFYKNVAEKPVNTIIATYSKNAIEAAFKTNSKDDSNDSGSGSDKKKEKGGNKNKNKSSSDSDAPKIEVDVVSNPPKGKGIKATKVGKRNSTEDYSDKINNVAKGQPKVTITDKDVSDYITQERRNNERSKVPGPKGKADDFDAYFTREVAKQYKKDHGVLPYSTDAMTIREIREDKEYRQRMGLPERDYKKRVNY